jgi:hypothetical protein
MQMLRDLLTKKFFLSCLVAVTGILAMIFVSHAIWHNTTHVPSDNRPDSDVAVETDKNLSGYGKGYAGLEVIAKPRSSQTRFDMVSELRNTFKKDNPRIPFDDSSVLMAHLAVTTGDNPTGPIGGNRIDVGQISFRDKSKAASNRSTGVIVQDTPFLYPDFDIRINEQLGGMRAANTNPENVGSADPELFSAEESSSPVPEPSTMFLVGSGLVGLAALARRNRKK